MKTLRILTALFAVAAAILLIMWVLELVSDEATKDAIIKVAAVFGIFAALSAVIQLVSSGKK